MPFIALDKESGQRIDITKIENPRLVLKSGDCICQLCKEPLIVKAGLIIRPHFAHYSDRDCNSEYKHHPESVEHRKAKEQLAKLLKETYVEYTTATIEYEVVIKEVQRVADVLVTFPMGWRIAHEIQLSPISPTELEERTNDYSEAGIDVVWWLGKSADNVSNRKWCIENFGYCFSLNLKENISTEDLSVSSSAI